MPNGLHDLDVPLSKQDIPGIDCYRLNVDDTLINNAFIRFYSESYDHNLSVIYQMINSNPDNTEQLVALETPSISGMRP